MATPPRALPPDHDSQGARMLRITRQLESPISAYHLRTRSKTIPPVRRPEQRTIRGLQLDALRLPSEIVEVMGEALSATIRTCREHPSIVAVAQLNDARGDRKGAGESGNTLTDNLTSRPVSPGPFWPIRRTPR